MHFHCAMLIVVALVVVGTSCVLALVVSDQTTATKTTASAFEFNAEDAVATSSLLKSSDAADADQEDQTDTADDDERVYIPGISIVAELTSNVNSGLARGMWLSSRETPGTLFVKLLGKTGVSLESNPKLVEWLRFTEAYNAKHGVGSFPESSVYTMLSQRMSESGMEQLLQSLKEIPDLTKFGAKMENAHRLATRTPSDFFKALGLDAAGAKLSSDNPNLLKWLRFASQKTTGEKINAMLAERMSKADLAMFYHFLKDVPDLKALGDDLKYIQFKKWIDDGVSIGDVKGFLGNTEGSKAILRDYAMQVTKSELFKSRVDKMKALYRGDEEGADVAATLAAFDKYYSNK